MLNKMKEKFSAMKMGSKKGFTLIELVVVIAIMAILALIMVPNLTAYIQKADDSKVQANLKNIHTSTEMVIQTNAEVSVANAVAEADTFITELSTYTNVEAAKLKSDYNFVEDGNAIRVVDVKSTWGFDGKEYKKVTATPAAATETP